MRALPVLAFSRSDSRLFLAIPSSYCKIGSLSNNVFERRTSTGSGLFSFFDGGFAQIFSQIASITVKKLRNTNFISSRYVKRENTSLPVDVRRSKTSLLKLPNETRPLLRFSLSFFYLSFLTLSALFRPWIRDCCRNLFARSNSRSSQR